MWGIVDEVVLLQTRMQSLRAAHSTIGATLRHMVQREGLLR